MRHAPVDVDVLDRDRRSVLDRPAGDARPEREPAPLPQRLDRVLVGRHADAARTTGSELRLDVDHDVVAVWDRARIAEVLDVRLSNAVKFGRGHPIEVRLRAWADATTLEVSDQGLGMTADEADRVFDRFERAVSPRHYGGLGLGLYIARTIVEAHGGEIRVKSAPGRGTTITVVFPTGRVPASAPTPGQVEI